jgi:hypothetical protein
MEEFVQAVGEAAEAAVPRRLHDRWDRVVVEAHAAVGGACSVTGACHERGPGTAHPIALGPQIAERFTNLWGGMAAQGRPGPRRSTCSARIGPSTSISSTNDVVIRCVGAHQLPTRRGRGHDRWHANPSQSGALILSESPRPARQPSGVSPRNPAQAALVDRLEAALR